MLSKIRLILGILFLPLITPSCAHITPTCDNFASPPVDCGQFIAGFCNTIGNTPVAQEFFNCDNVNSGKDSCTIGTFNQASTPQVPTIHKCVEVLTKINETCPSGNAKAVGDNFLYMFEVDSFPCSA
ncbi:hypothetical protein DFH08DRAFT_840816 [Mycena albidolilacea]|uniref:Glycan binding protein Y3-like domain-containing protein n=1 Tax=Mycena albidolilacea TaxID=1033008 RepID=A0AAD7AMQ5_9AGAR|nr:hypothetical protein DFH08DRAFT_840816 [Mycena albidolilacea]